MNRKNIFLVTLCVVLISFNNHADAAVITAIVTGIVVGTKALIAAALTLKGLFYLTAIAAALYSIVSGCMAKDKLNFPQGKYTSSEITNTYSNVPIVPIYYGGPVQVGGNIFWQTEPSTTVSRFVGLSIGECQSVTDVRLDDLPIEDIDGCSYTFYNGTSTQKPDSRANGECKGLRDLSYLAITIESGPKLSSNPVVSCQLTGRKIQTWNSETQDWTTNEVSSSKNPAAILRDYLLLSPILGGCGLSSDEIDDDSFGDVFEYCNEMIPLAAGGEERRFEMTIGLDTEHPALDNIAKMLITCGMYLNKSNGQYKLAIDRNDSTSVFSFDKDNIIKGTFEYGYGHQEEPYNKVFVKWWKPDELKNPMRRAWSEDTVDINNNGERSITFDVVGIDRETQALRMARQILYQEKVNNAWARFDSTFEAMHLEIGDVVSLTHGYPGWNGKLFTVKGIEDINFGIYKFHLQAYNSTILSDSTNITYTDFDIPETTNPWAAVDDVSNISVTEANYQNEDGTYKTHLTLTWDAPTTGLQYLTGYIIQMKIGENGTYTTINTAAVGDTSFTMTEGVVVGSTYFFRIKTHSHENITSNGVESNPYIVQGAGARPQDVTGFGYTFTNEITLYWNPVTNADIDSYEIRLHDNGWGNADSDLIFRANATKYKFKPTTRSPGTYYIRARNKSGRYSWVAMSVTPVNGIPAAPTNFTGTVFFNIAQIKWDNIVDDDLKYYEIYTSYNGKFEGEEQQAGQASGSSSVDATKGNFFVEGETPKSGAVDSATKNTITDSLLGGLDNYARIGDRLLFMSGENEGEERNVVDYNRETGTFYVDEDFTYVPQVDDKFIVIDVVYVKVRAIDQFGPGPFSSSLRLEFESVSEDMLDDNIITARKIYAGEVITLSAQIKDAIIQNAHILSLSADKITAGTIQAAILILGTGGEFKSENYVQNTSGFRMWSSGLEINEGAIQADLVIIGGASLQEQFTITEQNTIHDTNGTGVRGWEKDGYSTNNVTIDSDSVNFNEGQLSGYYISPPIEISSATLGFIQWVESISVYSDENIAINLAASNYTAGYSGGLTVGNAANCFDENTGTTADWVDGTSKWGQFCYSKVDLGEAKTIKHIKVYESGGGSSTWGWYIDYSTNGTDWTQVGSIHTTRDSYVNITLDSAITARYWRFRSNTYLQYRDGPYCMDMQLYEEADVAIKFYTRTDDASDMLSPTAWAPAAGLTTPAGSQMTSATNTYLQYKIEFTASETWEGTAEVSSVQVNYDIVVAKNAEALGGYEPSTDGGANTIPVLDASGYMPANSIAISSLKTASGEVAWEAGDPGPTVTWNISFCCGVGTYTSREIQSSSYLSTVYFTCTGSTTENEETLPGGQYGFYPQLKYITDHQVSIQQRYVTASGPDHWIFLLVAKIDIIIGEQLIYKKGAIIGMYQAPDHPATNNGGDINIVPHPFGSYKESIHEIVVVDNNILKNIKQKISRNKSVLDVIRENYVIDDTKQPKYKSREIMLINEFPDEKLGDEILYRVKNNKHLNMQLLPEEFTVERKIVSTLPTGMLFKTMALK